MPRVLKKIFIPSIVIPFLAVILYPNTIWLGGNIVGKAEAHIDISQHKKIYRRCQNNCVWVELMDEFEKIMSKDYGIEVVSIDACYWWGFNRGRTTGYNQIMLSNFDRTLAPNLLHVSTNKAFDEFQAKYRKKK